MKVLGLYIWNQLPETMKAKWSFQTFKRLLRFIKIYLDLSGLFIPKLAVTRVQECY